MKIPTKEELKYLIQYKFYPRFQHISFPRLSPCNEIERLLSLRRTNRFSSKKKLSKNQLFRILFWGAGITNRKFELRAYPSAGARYPLEIYIIVFDVKGIIPGVYHFNPLKNALVLLWEECYQSEIYDFIAKATTSTNVIPDWIPTKEIQIEKPLSLIVITNIEKRTISKYGKKGKTFPILEAGYLSQNLLLLISKYGFHGVPLGIQWDIKLFQKILEVDPKNELPLHAILIL
jgi:SagB-type dehydrogenase family enzyme